LSGGTSLVLRRIAMNLDSWDGVDRVGREFAVGRTLDTGAPLTGTAEHDVPDFEATTASGLPVISDVAHIRRAQPADGHKGIVRLSYNYDDSPAPGATADTGLLFGSWQADVGAQFTPIQTRLIEGDLLNTWTTPVGSAVFAIPPGCAPGGHIGDQVLA
jgi:dye decolorizing peroxidase